MLLFLNIYHLLEVCGQGTDSWMLTFSWFPPLFHFIQPGIPIQNGFSLHSSSEKTLTEMFRSVSPRWLHSPSSWQQRVSLTKSSPKCLQRFLCKGHPCHAEGGLRRGAWDASTHSANSSEPATYNLPNLVPGKMKMHYFLLVDIIHGLGKKTSWNIWH